ncbi:MAG: bifunctional [glutamate--ammonia ligase]-adenylyl-L-tyrosine phosphorylase/[glutamate--ammonia-ligase] adenylyltransferase [Wenzhouxiangella sp.]|jgi:glutamate-ammonia-ligase adenylyltransferase|nr:bifunctional [glutamate--ammonia ligase]-adenylyl-L-tyrosine phosphorylase/[glutamate--ammonia-ligase] adenylyltransferase [Wenzhouxiangella sp.]
MKRRVQNMSAQWLAKHSRFVDEVWRRFPEHPDPSSPAQRPDPPALAAEPEMHLRRYRQLQSVHILWQDLSGQTSIEQTGHAISRLARECLEIALEAAEQFVQQSCGDLLNAQGTPIRLAILGLGKLGGDELNFNSDIDIVLAFEGEGTSTGPRRLDAPRYLQLVAREVIRLLDTITTHGRVWVIDTRLRPFGDAGALVWSLPAMEQYFLTEGRAWERYAWLKAAPVAGDTATAERLLDVLQPFIYRRYLDYGIFDSLRALHERIETSTVHQDGVDIKRGPDGIRAAEFLVQSHQILRGGHDPRLRVTGFLPALEACSALGLIEDQKALELGEAYRYLRILENRLQAMSGRQGHRLPGDAKSLECLASLMGCSSRHELEREIAGHQARIGNQFKEHFRSRPQSEQIFTDLWPPEEGLGDRLIQLGFEQGSALADQMFDINKRLSRRKLTAEGQRRLERLMPDLLEAAASASHADETLGALLQLIEQISRRSAYLSLLHERPQTLARLVRVFSCSEEISRWIIQSPQLLDDLLDPVNGVELPALPKPSAATLEDSLNSLSRWRQGGFLRTALAELDGRLDPKQAGERLSVIAETVLAQILELLNAGDSDIAIVGYGNLGAKALHYQSDLDLVFLHQEDPPPLRLAQRLISLMQTPLPGGRLFEVDTRLRPNGGAGMLLSRIDSFRQYQLGQAWTWEHQALIRARWVAGSTALREEFETIRTEVLCRERQPARVLKELAEMRDRQRRSRPETEIKALITDLQYLVEAGILCQASQLSGLATCRSLDQQIDGLQRSGWFSDVTAEQLRHAYGVLIRARHLCWLQRHPDGLDLQPARDSISVAWTSCFGSGG